MAQLERGKRMVELLKQGQYVPMSMEEQVFVLFAGTQGFIDDVPVESIGKFEEEVLRYVRDQKSDILNDIKEKQALDDDLKARMQSALEDFKKTFQA